MLLRRAVALGAAAGILAAPKLWITSGRLFPTLPALSSMPLLPFPLDYILLGLTVAALLAMAVSPRPLFTRAFLLLAGMLVLIDQSRLQPWLIEFAVLAGGLLAGAGRASARIFFLLLYPFAGLHKLNYGFVLMLVEMLRPLALRFAVESWLVPRYVVPAAVAAALWELGWGIALAFPRTRRPAAACLALMHVALLALLGPLGLDINRSVWSWNVANIVLLWALFWKGDPFTWTTLLGARLYPRAVLAGGLLAGVLALTGIGDAYVGFGLYSGRVATGALYIDPKRIPDLPEPLRPLVKSDGVLDINAWAIRDTGVPVYPATRVYSAAGRQVAIWLRRGDAVRVFEFSPSLFSPQRSMRAFDPLTR